jgi:hypothetical protein
MELQVTFESDKPSGQGGRVQIKDTAISLFPNIPSHRCKNFQIKTWISKKIFSHDDSFLHGFG